MMLEHKISIENNDIFLSDNDFFYLDINKYCELNIMVNKNVHAKLIIIGTSNYNLNITLCKDANLIVNSINKNNSVNITLSLYENSVITYNHSITSNGDSTNVFNVLHKENNSKSILNNHGINLSNGKLFFTIDGIVPNNLVSISCNQNSRIINYKNGDSKIIPNLIIDSNDIVANHSAYIGIIDCDDKL